VSDGAITAPVSSSLDPQGEEEHADWLETQLELLSQLREQLYLTHR